MTSPWIYPLLGRRSLNARPPLDPDLVRKVYGDYGDARQIFEDARAVGIIFLDEGNHHSIQENGAILHLYASPWTPSLGDWGFQCTPGYRHKFEITQGIDLVITHGPPKGIMDYTESKQRAGCPDLFGAIARARPRIHEGWGAKLVTWRDQLAEKPSHFTDIDNERSVLVEKPSGFRQSRFDTEGIQRQKLLKAEACRRERCCTTIHCPGYANPLEFGKQTLFVNAAIEGTEEYRFQMPWLVKLELQRAV